MTSERPYSDMLTPEAASAEIRDCAGTQFDPAVVAAFCALDLEVGWDQGQDAHTSAA
jgi:HD-GYP domain-containing protein (c-di-GMP phosphodiesterase class II)